jgi:hypothetical protein
MCRGFEVGMLKFLRQSWLGILAVVSVGLAGLVAVSATGSLQHSGCVGWNRLREATTERIVADDYSLQLGGGGLWIGCCRTSLAAGPIFDTFTDEFQAKMHEQTRNVDVFSIDSLVPKFGGLGKQTGGSENLLAAGRVLTFEVDGWLFPQWVLLVATAVVPGIWLIRQVRRRKG